MQFRWVRASKRCESIAEERSVGFTRRAPKGLVPPTHRRFTSKWCDVRKKTVSSRPRPRERRRMLDDSRFTLASSFDCIERAGLVQSSGPRRESARSRRHRRRSWFTRSEVEGEATITGSASPDRFRGSGDNSTITAKVLSFEGVRFFIAMLALDGARCAGGAARSCGATRAEGAGHQRSRPSCSALGGQSRPCGSQGGVRRWHDPKGWPAPSKATPKSGWRRQPQPDPSRPASQDER